MKRYRIGEFAQKLGVTPDLLKYCELKGIITPEVEKNGYRYYDFRQAARLLEYLKCRNQGMAAEEIRSMLQGASYEEVRGIMRQKADELRRQKIFGEELLRYYEGVEQLSANFGEKPVWQVRWCEGFYFLPHSVEHDFIDGEATDAAVRAWNACLPVVQSTLCLKRDEQSGWLKMRFGENRWGFSIPERAAKRLGLPVDAPVEHVPSGRFLEVFRIKEINNIDFNHTCEQEIMERNGLSLTGDGYSKVILKLMENGVRREYSVLYLPIDG